MKVGYVKPGNKCGIGINHCVGHDSQVVTVYKYGVNIWPVNEWNSDERTADMSSFNFM